MHWTLRQDSPQSVFDMPNADMAWRFMRFSKHAQPILRDLEANPSLLPRLMDGVLNPFETIVRRLRASDSTTFYTVLPIITVSGDWRKDFLDCMRNAGYHVTFLFCANEGCVGRLLFSLRASFGFNARNVCLALAPVFRWKAGQEKNPFVPLLLVSDAVTWALAVSHVGYYRVQTLISAKLGAALDDVEILKVPGLSLPLVKLAINFATNLPFQRQIRCLISMHAVSEERDAGVRTLGGKLEEGGFKIDLTMQRELVWVGSRQVANGASCLFHVRSLPVADEMNRLLRGLVGRFRDAYFRMRALPMDSRNSLLVHVVLFFDEPVLMFGEDSLNAWTLAMSRKVDKCSVLSVTPLDVLPNTAMNPLASLALAYFRPDKGLGLEGEDLMGELRRFTITRAIQDAPICLVPFVSGGLERQPAIQFVSAALPVMRVNPEVLQQTKRKSPPRPAARVVSPIVRPVVVSSPVVRPVAVSSPVVRPVVVSSPVVRPAEIPSPISKAQPSPPPVTPSGENVQHVFVVEGKASSPRLRADFRAFFPLACDVLDFIPKLQMTPDVFRSHFEMAAPRWLTMDIPELPEVEEGEHISWVVYDRGQRGLLRMFRASMERDVWPLLADIGAETGKMLVGDSDALERLHVLLVDCAASMRGIMPFPRGFKNILPRPELNQNVEGSQDRKRPRAPTVETPSKKPAPPPSLLQRLPENHPLREIAENVLSVQRLFADLVPEHPDWGQVYAFMQEMTYKLAMTAVFVETMECVAPGCENFK